MNTVGNIFNGPKRVALAGTLVVLMLASCNGSNDVPVSVHGVNYSDQEFTYVLQDPLRPSNQAGGETIGRYESGGTMCCFTLPGKWRPGIKINIQYTYYLPKKPDGSLPEIRKSTVVELPHYDEPQELWVLRNADGSMGIVSSIYQPDHPKWPGKIKGWPVPSLEYRRERWGLYMKHELDALENSQTMLNNLLSDPEKEAKEAWDFAVGKDLELKSKFSGFNDPKYLSYLEKSYKESLVNDKKAVEEMKGRKP